MKRPTWATIIGVLAIIFGIFGVLGGAQEIAMPSILEMQKEMMAEFSKGKTPDGKDMPQLTLEIEEEGEPKRIEFSQMMESMQEQFKVPEWYESWSIVFGIVSMVVAGLYLISGIFLMMTKDFAIKLFYIAIAASVIWAIIQAVISSQSNSGFLMAQIPGSISSIVIDIILLIVVLVGSKEAFVPQQEEI
ncbi:hypothetical protein ACJJIW_11630 [Microbulbifer sp. JMSA004]|uniref:hypothetical protein n=1 Tax=unclassified Microbulbifer TaxID=2619833 RepID=UPI00403AFB7A